MYKRSMVVLLLVLAPMVTRQALAATGGGSTTSTTPGGGGPGPSGGSCYQCRKNSLNLFFCQTVERGGGRRCVRFSDDLCTVDDPCGGAGISLGVSVPEATLSEILKVHPRVAATLWAVTYDKVVDGEGSTSWYDSPITAADVEELMQNGRAELEKTDGEPVVYRHFLDQDPATGQWSLVITPEQASDLDGPFSAFVLELNPVGGSESLVAGRWSLF